MQLILQPCSDAEAQQHYIDTIENPVPIGRILPCLGPEERLAVEATFHNAAAVWGVTPGKKEVNVSKWQRILPGDSALLYKDRKFFFRGTVAYKTRSPELSRELWGEKADGSTWEYVFFLTDLEPIDIGIDQFNAAAGYQPNFIVQGFNVLSQERSERIMESLDIDPGSGAVLPSEVEAKAAMAALDRLQGEMDVPSSVKRRKEQSYLRTILLGNKRSERCSICGRDLPVNLLVIGHIRRRHSCTAEHKRDLGNVMPVCVLGCDSLFEHGYIYVDTVGEVRAAEGLTPSAEVLATIASLVGRPCGAWNANSEPFFAWHRAHPRRFI